MTQVRDRRAVAGYVATRTPASLIERTQARVTITPSGCWFWTGAVRAGQPELKIHGSRRCLRPALLAEVVGSGAAALLQGRRIKMICGGPYCVRPDHMAVGGLTVADTVLGHGRTDDSPGGKGHDGCQQAEEVHFPEGRYVERLMGAGGWDEVAASQYCWRYFAASLTRPWSHDTCLDEDQYRALVAAVLPCRTAAEVMAEIQKVLRACD